MSEAATLDTECDILEQVLEPNSAWMSPEAAQALLRFQFNASAVARINELAEKNRRGSIAPSERALLERYQRVGNFLNLMPKHVAFWPSPQPLDAMDAMDEALRRLVWDRAENTCEFCRLP